MKIKKYLPILYTAGISMAMFGALLFLRGFYPFGNGSVMLTDMYDECVPSLYRFYDIINGHKNIFYEFQASGGLNLYTETINEIVNPFNYILLFWKRENIYLAVNILLVLYAVFAACSAHFCLIKIWNRSTRLNCLLSLCYAFSGYFAYNFQILRWMIIPVLFPLFLLSCIYLWKEQKGALYSILLAYQIILSVQHGYMTLLFSLFTSGIWMYCLENKKDRKKFCLSVTLYTIIGLLLSAIVLLPTVSTLLNSARSGANASYSKVFVEHGLKDIFERLFQFCHPVLVGILLVYLYGFIKEHNASNILKDSKVRFLIVWNAFLWFTVFVQPVNLLWHMGSYVCFPVRYGYMLIFAMICLIKGLDEKCVITEINQKEKKIVNVIKNVIVFVLSAGAVILLKINESDIVSGFLSLTISSAYTKEAVIVLAILLMLFVATIVACINKKSSRPMAVFIMVVSSYCYFNMISLPEDFRKNQEATYQSMVEEYQTPENNSFKTLIQRKKQNADYPRNASLMNGISSMSGYFPTAEAAFQSTMDKLGYMTPWVSTIDIGGTKISDYYFSNVFILPEASVNFELNEDMPLENQKMLLNELFLDELSVEELESIFSIVPGKSSFDIQNETTIYLDAGTMYQDLEIKVNDSKINIPMENMQDSPHVLLCLGTFDKGKVRITINTVDGEPYPFENTKIGLLDEQKWKIVTENTKNEFDAEQIGVKSKAFQCELELSAVLEEGVLVLPINAAEGWKAEMDGKAVEVISVGNCFAGVVVEKGEHLLKLEFHPPFWSVGSIASLTGLILLLIMYICKERNATICFGRIETITEILYLFVFWGAVLVVYIIPTVAITIHMTGRIVKLLL